MLYNNPVAYKTDFLPWQIAELASDHPGVFRRCRNPAVTPAG